MHTIKELYRETGEPVSHALLSAKTGIPISDLIGFTYRLHKSGQIKRNKPKASDAIVFFYINDPDMNTDTPGVKNAKSLVLDIVKNNKSPREDGGWTVDQICAVVKHSTRGTISTALRRLKEEGSVRSEEPDLITVEPV